MSIAEINFIQLTIYLKGQEYYLHNIFLLKDLFGRFLFIFLVFLILSTKIKAYNDCENGLELFSRNLTFQ